VQASDFQYRALLPQLLRTYASIYDEGPVRFGEPYRRMSHVIHAWFMRCQRGVEAVMLLAESGFTVESAPLRRSVLEHRIGLTWLVDDVANASTVIGRGSMADAVKRKNSIERAGWTSVDLKAFDEVIADGKDLDSSTDNQLHFRERCDRAGSPHDWAAYLIETSMSHPGWESARPYLEVDYATGRIEAKPEPFDEINLGQWAATEMYQALSVVNAMLEGEPLDDALFEFKAQLLPLIILAREEKGLPIPEALRQE
jgi:hypothetical protein